FTRKWYDFVQRPRPLSSVSDLSRSGSRPHTEFDWVVDGVTADRVARIPLVVGRLPVLQLDGGAHRVGDRPRISGVRPLTAGPAAWTALSQRSARTRAAARAGRLLRQNGLRVLHVVQLEAFAERRDQRLEERRGVPAAALS